VHGGVLVAYFFFLSLYTVFDSCKYLLNFGEVGLGFSHEQQKLQCFHTKSIKSYINYLLNLGEQVEKIMLAQRPITLALMMINSCSYSTNDLVFN